MAVFSSLGEKLNHIFSKMTKRGKLTELEIKQSMREIRIALLEADVNLNVVKNFVASVSEKAVGQDILKSLSPAQQVVKIVNDELVALMGSTNSKLAVSSNPPTVIMMCGLQGAGKTTLSAKLGLLLTKQGKKPLLAACDVYRPAAIDQLQTVGKKAGVEVFSMGQINPVEIAKKAIEYAKRFGFDTVIIDTAGRLQIDEKLMQELDDIKAAVNPDEILLTVDSMTGQVAVEVADTFNKRLNVTGVILTKLDGDTRGGACLSIKAVTGKPIKFIGVGEKLGDLEPFYPDRMANRILGMGDVLSIIEKAQEAVTEEDARRMEKKFKENSFTLDDYLEQFAMLKKMGGISSVLGMMPGMGKLNVKEEDIDESKIERVKAIILSMTKRERKNPDVLNYSRKMRVAKGSGTTIQEVNSLLKQFEQSKQMMKQLKNRGGKMPFRF
ncbi:MAG: signal recognition particle protein [Candidatus Borkfalkiaceae bacterium]|nr:signal recognition particle protein [Christensenellaceae bacterium]